MELIRFSIRVTMLTLFALFMLNIAVAQELAQPAPAAVVGASPVVQEVSPIEAPPSWLVGALKMVANLPVVGPILTKIFQWAGVLSVMLTLLVAFLLAAIKALKGALSWTPLNGWVTWLEAFEGGQIMYYLKFLSMFNAKAPVPILSLKK